MTNDLAAFLLSRLAWSEDIARRARDADQQADRLFEGHSSPSWTLREVDAQRRIIAELWDADEGFATEHTAPRTAKAVLALLALPYADHPDYRQEWKP